MKGGQLLPKRPGVVRKPVQAEDERAVPRFQRGELQAVGLHPSLAQ